MSPSDLLNRRLFRFADQRVLEMPGRFYFYTLHMSNLLLAAVSSCSKMAIERFSSNDQSMNYISSFSQMFS